MSLIQFFAYAHLPAHLQERSKPFAEAARHLSVNSLNRLAAYLAETLPPNCEGDEALRKVSLAVTFLSGQTSGGVAICPNAELAMRELLEAKDCAVRAHVFKPGVFTIDAEGKAVPVEN